MKTRKKIIMTGILSLILGACAPQNQNTQSDAILNDQLNSSQSSIIGGTNVSQTSPIKKTIVAVYDAYEGQLCTGSLITSNVVMTAAHCIGQMKEAMYILFDTQLKKDSLSRQADMITVNPAWAKRQNESLDTGDVAIIHFKGALPEGYQPIGILPDSKYLVNGASVTLAGFGISNGATKEGAGVLRQVDVTIANANYSKTEVELDQRQGRGACHGDSGGPAYVKVNGYIYLWGITSRGVDDAKDDCSQFSAYTNAVVYKSWINSVVKQMNKATKQTKSAQTVVARN